MRPGKNPGRCSRPPAKVFAGAPANIIRYKLNKINRYYQRKRGFDGKKEEKS